ncbi:MAG: hypothetical protein JRH01_15230 [Deltaproteobacteria bacterium]|nr:hypothetical protein [Deltaproteobacteria bacterium]MBW2392855.1 hypothetical protein [Deltaproteobacteria bacterium]
MHARYRIAALPLFAVAITCATPAEPPMLPSVVSSPVSLGSGEVRITHQVVVLLDGSGTMHDRGSFPVASQLTRSFVAGLPAKNAATRAGGPADYLASFTGFQSTSFLPGAPAATAFDSASMQTGADAFQSRTGTFTPIPYTLRLAHDAIRAGSLRKAVVLVSDGLGDNGSGPNEAMQEEALVLAKAMIADSEGEVCLWAVHVGQDAPGDPVSGEKLMRDLGQLSPCGGFRKGEELVAASGASGSSGVLQLVRDVMLGSSGERGVGPDIGSCEGLTFSLNFLFNQYSLCHVRAQGDSAEGYSQSLAANRSRKERPGACEDALGPRQVRAILPKVIEALRECPDDPIYITGRTDTVDTPGYNQCLSELRAWELRSYLAKQLEGAAEPGIRELFLKRSKVVGLGESTFQQPVRPECGEPDNAEARGQMRRTEILTGRLLRGEIPAGVQPITSPPAGLAECRARRGAARDCR